MLAELKLNIDDKTLKFAEKYANKKGFSLNEMLEYYLKWIVWNDTFLNEIVENKFELKVEQQKYNWIELEQFLTNNRFKLPDNYSFNRNELYDR